jgi:squalene-hopene/tetraprenyl-beta-curcumene cyclase
VSRIPPGIVALCFGSLAALYAAPRAAHTARAWDKDKAASYLDRRIEWWMAWPAAARGAGTFCVSCHTALPYALARPVLRASEGEAAPTADERKLLEDVIARVRLWGRIEPFYKDQGAGCHTSARALGTEAVLNALILASYDAQNGTLSATTRAALEIMWRLQRTDGKHSGAWWWLQFDNEPFEAPDSDYYGATLAAIAAATAPGNYRSRPEIRNHLDLLRESLTREFPDQSPINHAVLLWASAKWPELLSPGRRQSIINEFAAKQQADGGWNLVSLSWTWKDWRWRSLLKMYRSYGTPLQAKSDGYATSLAAFALEQAGVPRSNPVLERALAWLVQNQQTDGMWRSYSLNDRRDPDSPTGRFMSDAATAYAVLALTNVR